MLGTCNLCDTGWISGLPHPACVSFGVWKHPFHTFAALCTCGLGKWRREGLPEKLRCKAMDFETYEKGNPGWQQQVADRQATMKQREIELAEARAKDRAAAEEAKRAPEPLPMAATIDALAKKLTARVEKKPPAPDLAGAEEDWPIPF